MIFLCKTSDVPTGKAKRIARGRKPAVAVFEVDGTFHATADQCTHGTALLSRGRIEDGRIICPLHFGSFDLMTGAVASLPCEEPLAVYAVEIQGDDIYADVPE
ncbi:non-heme iron oxygenase ferredoxin subunit [Novosphingobium sp. 9]|uniref:non-heme iron oxygenase ferredoxin subunit n=1 Tax=Novosphingobium sp. 9 TaxID=2025349 RepID=UPI0021B62483|nr:non-heme iron oxygenase ferredoxin subunit [Novosphingobium sp. 9]